METTSRTCRWVHRRLPLLVGDDLTTPDRRRVERHLIGCASCRDRRVAAEQSLAFLREAAGAGLASAATGGSTPSIWPALARQIRESRHQPARPSGMVRVWSWGQRHSRAVVGAGLAAGLLLALAGIWSSGRWPAVATTRPADLLARSPIVPPDSPPLAPVVAADPGLAWQLSSSPLDTFDVPIARRDPRSPAMPGDGVSPVGPPPSPAVNPFNPPLTLRFDFDLERGTVTAPVVRDTQRAL